ncbi:MAG: HNH endonuclease [Mycobacterium sp.]|nr:HNH endonuclease [Mycobacterium sp.]
MEILAALDDLEAFWDKLASLKVDALSAGQVLAVLDRLEVHRRRQPALEHTLITHLQSQATAKDMGAKSWRSVLAQRLGISGSDASRRIADAAALGQRRAVTGEQLEPELPATAAAQARGDIGTDHVTVIRDFMDHLPADVDPATRAAAESQLGGLAGGLTPEGLRKVARQLLGYLDQDGTLDDEREHARKRGITIGPQGLDGMSRLTGWITPELRATVDALFAKLAAPGYSNPDDESPCVDGVPSQEQISGDTRNSAQRSHDALHTVCRAMLASGTLGQHNGLPVTIVATTTLAELSAAAGRAHTGGGTQLPIPTLIRMAAAGAHPYLALFHNPREVQLYYGRKRRTASPGQRLALHALERGCTKPDCTAPPDRCQVHHAERDWQHGGNTDIDELTLACGCDNRLVDDTPAGWTTRKRSSDNRTEWIPPPHLDRGQHRINHYHHPEEILRAEDDEPG